MPQNDNNLPKYLMNNPLARTLNYVFGITFLLFLIVLCGIFLSVGKPITVLLIATAAVSVGAFIGFLYSTFGEEKERFSQVFVALNGLLGGATLTDLLKPDSSIVKVINKMTTGCGLAEADAGAVVAVIVTCAPLGFFWLYLNRKLVLNPATAEADGRVHEAQKILDQKPPSPAAGEDNKPQPDEDVKNAANILISRPEAGKSGTPGNLLTDGKAFYVLGKIVEAIGTFRKVLAARPNQPEAMLYLGSALVTQKKYLEAADILEKLITLPSAPISAFKLLGYAYLFYPDDMADKTEKLKRAIEVTEKYLAVEPTDTGAQLNLACAYGQLGPDYTGSRGKVIGLLGSLIDSRPDIVGQIKSLTQSGQDFEQWKEIPQFKALLEKE